MNAAVTFFALIIGLLSLGTLAFVVGHDLFPRKLIKRRVLVNLKTGEAVRGVLWEAHGPFLTLRDAAQVFADGRETSIDGEFVVERGERGNVAFYQFL